MTALPADIAAGTREATLSAWEDDAVKALYPGAREAFSPPAEGFYDSADDAETAALRRGLLLGVERRRFAVPVHDLLWIDPTAGLPSYRVVDAEQSVDVSCLAARIEIDLDAETTSLELFG